MASNLSAMSLYGVEVRVELCQKEETEKRTPFSLYYCLIVAAGCLTTSAGHLLDRVGLLW